MFGFCAVPLKLARMLLLLLPVLFWLLFILFICLLKSQGSSATLWLSLWIWWPTPVPPTLGCCCCCCCRYLCDNDWPILEEGITESVIPAGPPRFWLVPKCPRPASEVFIAPWSSSSKKLLDYLLRAAPPGLNPNPGLAVWENWALLFPP
jgi:hypothetical protein